MSSGLLHRLARVEARLRNRGVVMKRKQPHATAPSESGRVARVEPERYEEQLQEKVEHVRTLFADLSIPDIEVFRSPPSHYRLRCEFRVFHEGEDTYYVMFEKDEANPDAKPKMTRKDAFPAASKLINELMLQLLSHVSRTPVLRHRLYTAAFHTTLSGAAMVTLVYHKVLGEDWKEAGEKLSVDLAKECPSCRSDGVSVIGRSRKQKIVIGEESVQEVLHVQDQSYTYKQVEGCFSQPNGEVCQHMLSWAQRVSAPTSGDIPTNDLLELYCGNGNFTIPLSKNFRRVIATEVSRNAVQAGRENLMTNGITHVLLARMSSAEFVEKWKSGSLGRRLGNAQASDFNLSTLFVDPPRAGLDQETLQLVQSFDKVLYISCNPCSLYSNLSALMGSHTIHHFALFDQFPYTGHVECGVYLARKE